ncbi:flavin reductase family protein [Hyphomicrobium sp. 99]|uniref:flavin reductase family protein n=1 Tax=Hyphomicrobium sp. 99 TaxID=1163419 RepID=UPI0005F7A02C|nr:flavin reductase family protein [Hyphomicrobium sp. 99]
MTSADDWISPDDPLDLRKALACFATGITIITGTTEEGARFGLTASSFQPVSLTPPLVLYSVRKGAASVDLVKGSGSFCVNVLRHEHVELAKRFAAPIADRFEGLEWYRGSLGCPVLPDAIATFECRLWTTYDGGDHEIVVGEVAKMRRAPEGNPLVFFRGEFHPIVADAPRVS